MKLYRERERDKAINKVLRPTLVSVKVRESDITKKALSG